MVQAWYLRVHIDLVSDQSCDDTASVRTLHDPLSYAFHGIGMRRIPILPQEMQRGVSICSREMHDCALFQQQLHQLQIHSARRCHQWRHANIFIGLEVWTSIGSLDERHGNIDIQKRMRFDPRDRFTMTTRDSSSVSDRQANRQHRIQLTDGGQYGKSARTAADLLHAAHEPAAPADPLLRA